MSQDSVRIIPVPDQEATAVRGSQLRGPFPRHAHRSLVLGMVDSGVRRIHMPQGISDVQPGELFIIPPQRGHRCSSQGNQPHCYRVLCLPPDIAPVLEHLPSPRVVAPDAPQLFERFFQLLPPTPTSLPEREQLVSELLLGIVARCPGSQPPQPCPQPHPGVQRAMHAIAQAPWTEHSLDELAAMACLSKFHFQRLFVDQAGLSPADYQLQCRISRALDMIASGMPLAEAGLACGFADQSHFTRAFRRAVGVPPGRFLRHNPPPSTSKDTSKG
ncbi:MAG: AraC family transcriptional regulator [Proteobacteria bacterium]|nr:AraC family transcriptional regulator [Pseudomonadota bacterium]